VLGDGDRLSAAGGLLVREVKNGVRDAEFGEGSTAGVDGEEEGVILAEGERSLRAEGIGGAAATAAFCGVTLVEGEPPVKETLIGEHFVLIGVICHDEDSV
jgi:hypothetical protein